MTTNNFDQNIEQTDEELAKKREFLQQQAEKIIALADTPNTALHALHQINTLGGTTEKAYKSVQQRIVTDNDTFGAYHAIAMAQQTADLPFDVPVLLEILYNYADAELLFRLLRLFKNQPNIAEPIPSICQKIRECGDSIVIQQMTEYLEQRK